MTVDVGDQDQSRKVAIRRGGQPNSLDLCSSSHRAMRDLPSVDSGHLGPILFVRRFKRSRVRAWPIRRSQREHDERSIAEWMLRQVSNAQAIVLWACWPVRNLHARALIIFGQAGAVEADPGTDRTSADQQDGMAGGRFDGLKSVHEVAAPRPVHHPHIVIALPVISDEELPFGSLNGSRLRPVETRRRNQTGHENRCAELPRPPGRPRGSLRWKR